MKEPKKLSKIYRASKPIGLKLLNIFGFLFLVTALTFGSVWGILHFNLLGDLGPSGSQGPAGIQGPTGPEGPLGAPGTTIKPIITSMNQTQATASGIRNGDYVVNTAGSSLTFLNISILPGDIAERTGDNSAVVRGNLRGPEGQEGTQGTIIKTVSSAMNSTQATAAGIRNGDYVLNTTALTLVFLDIDIYPGDIAERTGENSAVIRGNLRGPEGQAGIQGISIKPITTSMNQSQATATGIRIGDYVLNTTESVELMFLNIIVSPGDIAERTGDNTASIIGNLKGADGGEVLSITETVITGSENFSLSLDLDQDLKFEVNIVDGVGIFDQLGTGLFQIVAEFIFVDGYGNSLNMAFSHFMFGLPRSSFQWIDMTILNYYARFTTNSGDPINISSSGRINLDITNASFAWDPIMQDIEPILLVIDPSTIEITFAEFTLRKLA